MEKLQERALGKKRTDFFFIEGSESVTIIIVLVVAVDVQSLLIVHV